MGEEGIDYLIRGTSYNKRQPILQWTLGIYTGQKIGIADEKKQYRELYRNDDEYHKHLISEGLDVKQSEALGADGKPDHWLSGRLWFLKAYDLVAAGHFCKKSPHLFYSDGPKCQMRFSEAIEDEGVLDDRAQFSWSRAGNQWREYGNRDLMTTWGHTIKLKGDAAAIAAAAQARSEFLAVTGPTRDKLLAKIREKLNAPEQALFDIPTERRTTEQQALLFGLNIPLEPTALEIAEACPKEVREKALELATKLKNADEFISHLNSYRQQVNYEYWETRAQSEQHPTTLAARQQMYAGDKLLQEAKLDEALIQYDKAWVNWAKVFRRFPSLIADDVSGDIMKSIRRYKRILDADLPKDFPLLKFYEYKLIADKNTGEIDMNRFIDALKSKVSQLPESDSDLPNDLNDFGNVGPAVQAEAPPPPLPGGKIPKTEEERAREAGVPLPKPAIKQPVTNAPDAGAPPAPEVQPAAKESPKGTSEGASAAVAPGRPPQVENPAPIR